MHQLTLTDYSYDEIITALPSKIPGLKYDYKRHLIELQDENDDTKGYLRLPLHLTLDSSLAIINVWGTAIYIAIESGSAAINITEGEENLYHTTFGAYMTRKKQGYSQIKYLNKKGKSRAGSRVRLAETTTFFENINTTLQELFDYYEFDRIALSCSISLLPLLYGSKVACPFDKHDEKLYKIPLHLPQSNFTNLDQAIKALSIPQLSYHEAFIPYLEKLPFFNADGSTSEEPYEEEDY
ncbi:MAG: hypothetical protein R8G66_10970 [Cytophagales bacterium]|nr:hypothetical protein [Cytophagales bacterium]